MVEKKEISCAANVEQINTNKIDYNPIIVSSSKPENINYTLFFDDKRIEEFKRENFKIFPRRYSDIDGVLTFRCNNLRNTVAFGTAQMKKRNLEIMWSFETSSGTWGGGAGWTGQPSIVKWPEDVRNIMLH